MNACGVAAARLQGHSWAPTPLKGSRMNVGTIPMVPSRCLARVEGGKTGRPLMLLGWGGGFVVVRAGESPVHGEGTQCGLGCEETRVHEPLGSTGSRRDLLSLVSRRYLAGCEMISKVADIGLAMCGKRRFLKRRAKSGRWESQLL